MSEIRITTDDLPSYKFPYPSDQESGYVLIQARDEERYWQPRWCLIDSEGTPLAILEADDFEGLSAESVAQAATNYVMELHGLSKEDSGVDTKAIPSNRSKTGESYSFELLSEIEAGNQ